MDNKGFSIKTKILLIPAIGACCFILYLGLSTVTASLNVSLLENARSVQFPLLKITSKLSSNIEKVETMFNTAVTTGDEEQISFADEIRREVQQQLLQMRQISKEDTEIREIESLFDSYYSKGRTLADGMVNQNIEIERLPQMGEELFAVLSTLKETVKEFSLNHNQDFEASIDMANKDSQRLVKIGVVMGVVTIALLFATAIPISRSIHASLSDVIHSLRDIAEGDGAP